MTTTYVCHAARAQIISFRSQTAVALGYFAASFTPNQEAALAVGPAVTTPLLVFGGIYGNNRSAFTQGCQIFLGTTYQNGKNITK
jgi:hypothetical protein